MANETISKIIVPSGDTYEFAPDYATKARNLVDSEYKEIYANYKENNFAVTDTDHVAENIIQDLTNIFGEDFEISVWNYTLKEWEPITENSSYDYTAAIITLDLSKVKVDKLAYATGEINLDIANWCY